MLKSVHFEGIKSLLNVTIDLERFTVLVGPNGCGKSTVLDQIAGLVQTTRPNSGSAHVLGAAGTALERLGVPNLGTIGRGTPLHMLATDTAGGQLDIRINLGNPGTWYDRASFEARTTGLTAALEIKGAKGGRPAFEALVNSLGWGVQRLALSPEALREPSPVDAVELEASGYGLATVLKDLAGDDTPAYLELQADLRRVVPAFRQLKFGKVQAGGSNPGQRFTLELVMQQGQMPVGQVSDGTLLALALLTATHDRALPTLILMDDIDHGLHLSAQYQIIEAIRRVMAVRQDLQVVCTTHSPTLLDAFKPEEVRVMNLDADGHTVVRPLTSMPDFAKHRRGLQTGELWASMGESWVTEGVTGGG